MMSECGLFICAAIPVRPNVCKWFHARRDHEWQRELERDVFGDDVVDAWYADDE
jgi:hypothetical protein